MKCSLYQNRANRQWECGVCGATYTDAYIQEHGDPECIGETPKIINPTPHLMLDLETLGRGPQSVITQIGAAYFNMDGDIGGKFSVNIQIQDCLNHGLIIDGSTIKWWFEQPESARTWIKDAKTLSEALNAFRVFSFNAKHVWSHSTFDIPIITNAYRILGQGTPFNYHDMCDLRTLTWLWGGDYKKLKEKHPQENKHDALSDCLYQIKYATYCFKEIKNVRTDSKNPTE
jgi:hypothetical protein